MDQQKNIGVALKHKSRLLKSKERSITNNEDVNTPRNMAYQMSFSEDIAQGNGEDLKSQREIFSTK